MDSKTVSVRQMLAIVFASLLSPAVRVLPGYTAAIGGEGGWLSTLVALPVLLLLCLVLIALFRRGDRGLVPVFRRTLGEGVGRGLVLVYLLWGLFLLSAQARLFGLRFLTTSYRNAPLPLFILAALGVTLWLAWRGLPSFARTGQIFCMALAAGLVVALALGAVHIQWGNFLPIWTQDVPGVLRSTLPALSVLGYGIFAAFPEPVISQAGDRRRMLRGAVILCVALTALQVVCLGNFGPGLTARMDTPFFMMVKGIGVSGAFSRVESVFIALWAVSDLTLMTLLTLACWEMLKGLCPPCKKIAGPWPIVLVALVGALFLFPDAFVLQQVMAIVGEWGGLILGFGVPAAVLAVGKLRHRV
jgi:spore germination protein KB